MVFARWGVEIRSLRIGTGFLLLLGIIPLWYNVGFAAIYEGFILLLTRFVAIGLKKEYIKINETGISCYTKKKECWNYPWEDILELRGSRCSTRIWLKPELYKNNVKNQSTIADFELCRTAKKALSIYCRCPIK